MNKMGIWYKPFIQKYFKLSHPSKILWIIQSFDLTMFGLIVHFVVPCDQYIAMT